MTVVKHKQFEIGDKVLYNTVSKYFIEGMEAMQSNMGIVIGKSAKTFNMCYDVRCVDTGVVSQVPYNHMKLWSDFL